MKAKICFCPSSINWIRKHLQKSARAGFNKMLRGLSPTSKITKRKRRFSQKQLRAQRLFAKRARAGTLRRRRR